MIIKLKSIFLYVRVSFFCFSFNEGPKINEGDLPKTTKSGLSSVVIHNPLRGVQSAFPQLFPIICHATPGVR